MFYMLYFGMKAMKFSTRSGTGRPPAAPPDPHNKDLDHPMHGLWRLHLQSLFHRTLSSPLDYPWPLLYTAQPSPEEWIQCFAQDDSLLRIKRNKAPVA